MSVRNCVFPWHWVLITTEGDVMPCSHGSQPVGNLRDNSIEEVWNGPVMREVRAFILAGEVHRVCRSAECPFQCAHPAFPEQTQPMAIDEELARNFDEDWYVVTHDDVREAVANRVFASGLEHFIRHGRAEGKTYRLRSPTKRSVAAGAYHALRDFLHRWAGWSKPRQAPLANAVLALVEHSRGATVLETTPVDIILAVSTVCNLRCVMCPHGMRLIEHPRFIAMELIDRIEPWLPRVSRIYVSGIGEPTLAPGFWRVVERVSGRLDVCVRANSNGHFMSEENARRVLNSGLTEISFSMDAAAADTYERIRGGDFARVLRGVSTLIECRRRHRSPRLKIFINMTLMWDNLPEAAEFVALGKRLGVDGVILSQLFPFGDRPDWRVERAGRTFVYSDQMLTRHPKEASRWIAEAKAASETLGVAVHYHSNILGYLKEAPFRHGDEEVALINSAPTDSGPLRPAAA